MRILPSVFTTATALLLTVVSSGAAQATRDVTGKVTQAGTSVPLADATVGVLGSPVGVRTNERGEYRMRVPEGEVTLVVRAAGTARCERL